MTDTQAPAPRVEIYAMCRCGHPLADHGLMWVGECRHDPHCGCGGFSLAEGGALDPVDWWERVLLYTGLDGVP